MTDKPFYETMGLVMLEEQVRGLSAGLEAKASEAKDALLKGATTGDKFLDWSIVHFKSGFYQPHQALLQAQQEILARAGEKFLLQYHSLELEQDGCEAGIRASCGESPYDPIAHNWLGILGSEGLDVRPRAWDGVEETMRIRRKEAEKFSLSLNSSVKLIHFKTSERTADRGEERLYRGTEMDINLRRIDPLNPTHVAYEDLTLTIGNSSGLTDLKQVKLIIGPKALEIVDELTRYVERGKADSLPANPSLDQLFRYFRY